MTTTADVAALAQQYADEQTATAVAPLQAQIADLQAQLAALQPSPAPKPATLFGSGIAGWALAGETPTHAYRRITAAWSPRVLRIWWGRLNTAWSVPQFVDPTVPIVVEITGDAVGLAAGKYDTQLSTLLATDPGRDVWVSAAHEPEGKISPAQWAAAQNHLGQLNHAAGRKVRVVPILQGGTYMPTRQGGWQKWWDGIDPTLVDALGSDSYQHGTSDPGDSAADVIGPVIDAAASKGLPVVLGELGARSALSDTARAQFLGDAVRLLSDAGAAAVCYYESDRGSPQLRPWCLLAQDGTARSPRAADVWAGACRN